MSTSGCSRYVVKIAVYAGHDPNQITESDLDDDHMEVVSQLLQQAEDDGAGHDEVPQFKGFRYDLCAECHRRFLKDPLNREPLRTFNFSKN